MTEPLADPGAPHDMTGTVLYIEDNEASRRLVGRIFERNGNVRLVPAPSGEVGLQLARERPDLILLDFNLPDMTGEVVLTRLRDDPETRHIPVVVMTADTTSDLAGRLEGLGARAFLTKPISIAAFIAVVADFLPTRAPTGDDGA
jgi:CheY-like chemotaxis protein